MRLTAIVLLGGVSLALAACVQAASPRAARPGFALAAAADAGSPETGADEDPRLEAALAELERVADFRSTVWGQRIDNPPNAARARRVPAGAPSLGAVASIRSYHFRMGRSADPYLDVGFAAAAPFTSDGRLADGVLPPEVELAPEERRQVLALIQAADERHRGGSSRAVTRCEFSPHHVLVLFDGSGAPLAKLFVCLSCHELLMLPARAAMGGVEPALMTDAERTTIARILDAHGQCPWCYDDDGPRLREARAYEARVYGAWGSPTEKGRARASRRAERPSGVPADVRSSNLGPADRDRACVWIEDELWRRARGRPGGQPYGAYECASGATYVLSRDSLAGCASTRWCDVPFGRLERCLRESFLDGPERICRDGPTAACEGLLACLPGVVWEPSKRR